LLAVTEAEFLALSVAEALAEAEATYDRIKSPTFLKEQEAAHHKHIISNESRPLFEGLDDLKRKKREMIMARVKKQYSPWCGS
jgi:hypothetical protein